MDSNQTTTNNVDDVDAGGDAESVSSKEFEIASDLNIEPVNNTDGANTDKSVNTALGMTAKVPKGTLPFQTINPIAKPKTVETSVNKNTFDTSTEKVITESGEILAEKQEEKGDMIFQPTNSETRTPNTSPANQTFVDRTSTIGNIPANTIASGDGKNRFAEASQEADRAMNAKYQSGGGFVQKALRTYESDVAEAMARKNISVASIVTAEEKRRRGQVNGMQYPAIPVKNTATVETPIPVTPKNTSNATMMDTGTMFKPSAVPTNQPITNFANNVSQQYSTSVSNNIQVPQPQNEVPRSSGSKKFYLLFASIICIGSGLIVGYYFYTQSPLFSVNTNTTSQPAPVNTSVSIITPETVTNLDIGSLAIKAIVSRMKVEINKNQDTNTIKEIKLGNDNQGSFVKINSIQAIEKNDFDMPNILKRSLTGSWMVGIYNNSAGIKSPFVILENNFFQNAFAGTIQWEKVMADDLRPYIQDITNCDNITNCIEQPINGHFVDKIVRNKDVRQFIDDSGHVLFMYSFIDKSKIVFTDKESTLAEIVNRLEKQTFVR